MVDEHFRGKVGQKAVIEKGDKVLITQDSRDNRWELPGGRMNVGELPSEGLARELREELGVEVDVCEVISIEQYFHNRDEEYALLIGYRAVLTDKTADFSVDPTEVASWCWVTEAELSEVDMYPDCTNVLAAYFKNRQNMPQ